MKRGGASGFTLLELAAAMLLGAAGATALWVVLSGAMRTDVAIAEQAADAGEARAALEALQADLRLLREVETPPGAAARLPAGVVAVDFLRAQVGETSVSWRIEGRRILRNAGGRDRALGRNIEGFRVEERGGLRTVRIHGAARMDGLVPAWNASASAACRLEGDR